MKLSWAEYSLPFIQKNSNITELLTLTKNYFNLSELHLQEISKIEDVQLDNALILPGIQIKEIQEDSLNFARVKELSPELQTTFKNFSGILNFYQNYKLKYIVIFKGKTSPKKLYAHLFPYLNNILKIEIAEKTAQEDFLCRINHELKTPLNAIIGQLNILSEDNSSLYISGAQKSAKELLNRIDNLLIYAKYTDEFVSNPTTFSVNEVLKDIYKEFAPVFNEKKITFILEPLPSDYELYTDPYYIKRIISSLLENSSKFTNKGSVSLVSKINNETITFTVTDTGSGFPPELASLIQKKAFIQEESYQSRTQKGTGLSLNLCFKIAQNLGGLIKISSEKNQGSSICLTLPAVKTTAIEVSRFFGKVLLVEDDVNNQLISKKYLQKLGFAVDIANHGKEALDLYEKNKYTFILMDCQMPVMDGYEATSKIRSKDSNQIIIACTAHALHDSKTRCFDVGMNGFLTKPVDPQTLKKAIFDLVPECADNFDDSFPGEIAGCEDSLEDGLNFIEKTLLPTFKNKIKEDFSKLNDLSCEELRKIFHRLKSTYAQFGFVKSQKHFSILQKTENFTPDIFHIIKKQTHADLVALEQWVSNQKETIHANH